MRQWFETPPGRYLLAWERAEFDRAVSDIFGYHALQLGLPELDALQANRMPHKWLALRGARCRETRRESAARIRRAQISRPCRSNESLDLVVLPHSLELDADPHAALREVERVLVPEGKVVICCLNPASLWGLRQRRAHLCRGLGCRGSLFLPNAGDFIGYWRLRDWLRLLSFEVESGHFGCYRPAITRKMAGPLRLAGPCWRALVADLRRGLFPGGGEARARHAAGRPAAPERKKVRVRPRSSRTCIAKSTRRKLHEPQGRLGARRAAGRRSTRTAPAKATQVRVGGACGCATASMNVNCSAASS